jgi:hypothetical protein
MNALPGEECGPAGINVLPGKEAGFVGIDVLPGEECGPVGRIPGKENCCRGGVKVLSGE